MNDIHLISVYLSPSDLFASYALMFGSQEALPDTKAYHEKRWRFMAGLFGVDHREPGHREQDCLAGAALLKSLIRERNKLEFCTLLSPNHSGMSAQMDQALYDHHKEALVAKVIALREHYDLLGGELFVKLFPQIEEVRVLRSRLEELGLPSRPPEPQGEMSTFLKSKMVEKEEQKGSRQHHEMEDDITFDRLFSIKVSEEVEARGRESLKRDVELIRQKAIDLGLADAGSVDAFIFDMPVNDFLKLSKGFPKVSRVDFRPPESPKPETPSGIMATINSLFLTKKMPPPPPLDIPDEETAQGNPLREQLERLRKENPGLFREYSQAHISHTLRLLLEKASNYASTVDNEF